MNNTSEVPNGEPAEGEIRRLKRERNAFAVLAICCVASIGFAVPRKVSSYRELERANDRLIELQQAVVANQQRTRDMEAETLKVQREISERLKQ